MRTFSAVLLTLSLPIFAVDQFQPPPFLVGKQAPAIKQELPPPTGQGRLGSAAESSASVARPEAQLGTPLKLVEPSRASLNSTRVLGLPLESLGSADRQAADLNELAETLDDYAQDTQSSPLKRLDQLKAWLAENSATEYTPSIALHIAQVSARNGDFLHAASLLSDLRRQLGSADTKNRAQLRMLDKILAQELVLYRRMGWRDRLETTIQTAENRQPGPELMQPLVDAKTILELWLTNPLESMQCGLIAHNIIAGKLGLTLIQRYDPMPEGDAQAAAWGIDVDGERNQEITTHGLSAPLLLERIEKTNPGWRWVRRTSGTDVPVPCIAHLRWEGRVGHYSAVVETMPGAIRIEDIYLEHETWIDDDAFARQCSGFFLVPPGVPVPENFAPAGAAEQEGIYGRNACPNGRNPECNLPCPTQCDGMPVMTFSRTVPLLYIQDRPLPYRAPFGPSPDLLIQYRQRDFSGDTEVLDDTSHLGPCWNHGLFSYIRAETGAAFPNNVPALWTTSDTFYRYTRNGTTNSAAYVAPYPDRPVLTTLTSPAGFRLTFNDGSQMDFRQPNLPVNPTRYFLSTVRDAGGRAFNIHYITDDSNRIDYVIDAAGTATKFLYEGADRKIRHIVTEYAEPVGPSLPQPADPAGTILPHYRHASFTYDTTGRLASIQDTAGIPSSFTYTSPTSRDIAKMTTPYGDTTVSYTGASASTFANNWSITVTNPEGLVNRVESFYHDYYTPTFGGEAGNPHREPRPPATISVRGSNVSFLSAYSSPASHNHVTMEWTPKYWREFQKARQHDPDIDPRLFAATTIWAMDKPVTNLTVSIPLAYKEPGQAAVFYNYDGQTSAFHAGTSASPSKTARRIEGRTPTDGVNGVKWVLTQQTYNELGLPRIHTDELGRKSSLTYHSNNRDVNQERFLASDNSTWHTLRTYTGYSGGLPGTITEASGLQTIYTRNANGQPTLIDSKKGSNSIKTAYAYNAAGLLTSVQRVGTPNATLESMTYDNLGRLATHTDSRGYERAFTFDALDRPLTITHPDNSTEEWSYTRQQGQGLDPTEYKDRANRKHRTVYDRIRRPIAKIDPMGKITRYEWCSCGSLSKLVDPAGRVTTWVRDIQGRVTEKLMPDGATKTTYTYQAASGRLATKTTPNDQGGANPTVTYWYYEDGSLRMEDWQDDSADVTYYYANTKSDTATNWDGLKRLRFVQDAIGEHAFTYVSMDAAATTPGEGLISSIDGPLANDDIAYRYIWQDRADRVRVQSDAATPVVYHEQTTTWDYLDRVQTISNTIGTFTHHYADVSARVHYITRPQDLQTAFTYNANGEPGGAGLLAEITNNNPNPANTTYSHVYMHKLSYDSAGRITTWWQRPGAVTEGNRSRYLEYNLSDELISSADRNNLWQWLDRQQWGLDTAGNWMSVSQTSGSLMQTRQHNLMNQLEQIGGQGSVVVEGTVNEFAEVTVNDVSAALYKDPMLNPEAYRYRAIVPVTQGTNTLTVTATDQDEDATTNQWEITVPASQRTFTYDANGNLLTDSDGREFVWDAKNRLKRVTVGGKHYEWDYDYRDRRVREYEWNVGASKPATCKQFIWHGNEIVQERTGTSATAGTIARNHYYGGFTIGATVSTAAKYQTFSDHLGNVREVVASSGTSPAIGTLITRYDYSPYQGPSKIYQHPGTNIEATFQTIGRYYHHEPSGLELALYRAYDPELGRWISEDPIGESDGPNLYALVRNAPTGALDLFGLAKIPYPGRSGVFYYTSAHDLNTKLDSQLDDGNGGQLGECVSLVKKLAGVDRASYQWIQGPTVESLLKLPDGHAEKGVLKPGVAIATFKEDGKFQGHAALWGGLTEENGADGKPKCNIYDQYNTPKKNPSLRPIPYSGGSHPGHGNSWSEFSIILGK